MTDITALIDSLRNEWCVPTPAQCRAAADALERLQRQNARMVEKLREIGIGDPIPSLLDNEDYMRLRSDARRMIAELEGELAEAVRFYDKQLAEARRNYTGMPSEFDQTRQPSPSEAVRREKARAALAAREVEGGL